MKGKSLCGMAMPNERWTRLHRIQCIRLFTVTTKQSIGYILYAHSMHYITRGFNYCHTYKHYFRNEFFVFFYFFLNICLFALRTIIQCIVYDLNAVPSCLLYHAAMIAWFQFCLLYSCCDVCIYLPRTHYTIHSLLLDLNQFMR